MNSVTLPMPPSVNRLYRAWQGRVIKSREYREWLGACQVAMRHQRPLKVFDPYVMTVEAVRPDKRRRDLGNLLKATEDICKDIGMIEDDCLAERIVLAWVQGEPGTIKITVVAA